MTEREDKLERALHLLARWGDAYPRDIFIEPDWMKVRALLEPHGITLDAVAAGCMRRVAEGVARLARDALK